MHRHEITIRETMIQVVADNYPQINEIMRRDLVSGYLRKAGRNVLSCNRSQLDSYYISTKHSIFDVSYRSLFESIEETEREELFNLADRIDLNRRIGDIVSQINGSIIVGQTFSRGIVEYVHISSYFELGLEDIDIINLSKLLNKAFQKFIDEFKEISREELTDIKDRYNVKGNNTKNIISDAVRTLDYIYKNTPISMNEVISSNRNIINELERENDRPKKRRKRSNPFIEPNRPGIGNPFRDMSGYGEIPEDPRKRVSEGDKIRANLGLSNDGDQPVRAHDGSPRKETYRDWLKTKEASIRANNAESVFGTNSNTFSSSEPRGWL